ncbi:MAG: paraquat-inducible protein A [Ferruginibacter sp.]
MNKKILIGLNIISICFLVPGLLMDALKIDISANFFIEINLFNERRSVAGTLQSLWESSNYLPFLLIFLFGIVVPLVKSGLIFYILLAPDAGIKWQRLVQAISKWAMADVFALGIFISFLGANAMKNTSAVLQPGFYYFTAYVLLSMVVAIYLNKINRMPTSIHP